MAVFAPFSEGGTMNPNSTVGPYPNPHVCIHVASPYTNTSKILTPHYNQDISVLTLKPIHLGDHTKSKTLEMYSNVEKGPKWAYFDFTLA